MEGKKNYDLLKEIILIEREFNHIEKIFNEEKETEDISMEIKKLSFIISKLDILNVSYLDEVSSERCKSLIERISKLKEEIDLEDYISKIEIIQILQEVTTSNRNVTKTEMLIGINEILKKIKITDSNIYDIVKNDLVYVNSIEDGNNKILELSPERKTRIARDILESLFFMVTEDMTSQKPFTIYEKIMIINTLDNVRKYLK